VVNYLLGREDVNSDKPDNAGRAPLSWSIINGHDSVVKQLLDRRDVKSDRSNNGDAKISDSFHMYAFLLIRLCLARCCKYKIKKPVFYENKVFFRTQILSMIFVKIAVFGISQPFFLFLFPLNYQTTLIVLVYNR